MQKTSKFGAWHHQTRFFSSHGYKSTIERESDALRGPPRVAAAKSHQTVDFGGFGDQIAILKARYVKK